MTTITTPLPNTPLIDKNGRMTREWFRYFSLLTQATGGTTNIVENIDISGQPGADGGEVISVATEVAEAWSYGSQNAGQIEDLRKNFDGLDPQIPGPIEFAEFGKQLLAQTPFGAPPTEPYIDLSPFTPFAAPPSETGSLQASANSGYRIVAAGSAVLIAGTVTVNNVNSLAANEFALTAKVVGGTQGILSVGTITANTSFVINSSNAADTSTVSWIIFSPIKG